MGSFTQSALLQALGWALFDSLWQMALLWLCYFLMVSLSPKMAAHRRHVLALLLVFAGTACTILSFAHYMTADRTGSGEWLTPLLQKLQITGYAFPATARQWMSQLLPFCSFFYLLALAWLLIRYSNHYLYSRRLKGEGLFRMAPGLRVFVEQTALRMGITRTVGVWLSSMVEGPVTLGFLRPVILIPLAMVNNLSIQQVEAVLLHELAHIKRYDYLLNLAVTILELVFFFNPFTRLLIHHIRKEREHRCDDLVIQFRYDPHSYASALLSLASLGRARHKLALAATGRNDRLLLQRVKRIMKQDQGPDRPGARPVLIFLFAMLAALVMLPHRAGPAPRSAALLQQMSPVPAIAVRRTATLPDKKFPRRVLATGGVSPSLRTLAFQEENRHERPAVLKQLPAPRFIDERNGDNEYSADQAPAAINISVSHIDLAPPIRSKAEQLLTTALTDPKNSASEVKARVLKAIAANEAAMANNREALHTYLKAIGDLSPSADQRSGSADQQPGGNLERRLLEEKARYEQEEIILQEESKILLERAIKKLSIVYI